MSVDVVRPWSPAGRIRRSGFRALSFAGCLLFCIPLETRRPRQRVAKVPAGSCAMTSAHSRFGGAKASGKPSDGDKESAEDESQHHNHDDIVEPHEPAIGTAAAKGQENPGAQSDG